MILNTHPENRKEMVKAICELTGMNATYLFTPTYAYQIGTITVSREGSINCEDEAMLEAIKPMLIERGWLEAEETPEAPADSKEMPVMVETISYYSELIQSNPEYEYAGVYADEGLSGTLESRPEFQRMLQDCRDGKIDRILCKSISRFARNTVMLLKTVRELKRLGVSVYFEEQNIDTMSGEGELMLTVLASFAQEESRSVSENCKWRIRKKFEQGIPTGLCMYGYKVKNGVFTIIPEEAEIVRRIFRLYLEGMDMLRNISGRIIPARTAGIRTSGRRQQKRPAPSTRGEGSARHGERSKQNPDQRKV